MWYALTAPRDGLTIASAQLVDHRRIRRGRSRTAAALERKCPASTGGGSREEPVPAAGARGSRWPWERRIFAHTSPVYVACGDADWRRRDPNEDERMWRLIEACLERIRNGRGYPRSGSRITAASRTTRRSWSCLSWKRSIASASA
jgi:hypothetical protein